MKTLKQLKKEWEKVTLLKMFEIEVIDLRTEETDYIIFNIDIEGNKFIAQHVALNEEQKNSDKISFVDWEIEESFSLDENLQTLHELCVNAIIDSEFYRYMAD